MVQMENADPVVPYCLELSYECTLGPTVGHGTGCGGIIHFTTKSGSPAWCCLVVVT